MQRLILAGPSRHQLQSLVFFGLDDRFGVHVPGRAGQAHVDLHVDLPSLSPEALEQPVAGILVLQVQLPELSPVEMTPAQLDRLGVGDRLVHPHLVMAPHLRKPGGADHPAGVDLAHLFGGELDRAQLEVERLRQVMVSGQAATCIRSAASVSTGRSTASISANCSGPAISGGESWITGSPRSSARHMRPRRKSSPDRKPRRSTSDSSSVNDSLVVLSLTSSMAWKYPAPRTSPTIGMSDRDSSIARNAGSWLRT